MDYLDEIENEIQAYFTTHHIPTYFYQCLFGECIKIWGMNLVAPCDTGYSYQDQIDEYLALTVVTAGCTIGVKKTREWIKEDIKCEYYQFCGFLTEDKL